MNRARHVAAVGILALISLHRASCAQTGILTVNPSVTNICIAVDGGKDGGQVLGAVTAGVIYGYQASGCVVINICGSGGCNSADPDGSRYAGNSCGGSSTTTTANANFKCSGLVAYSLVGTVNGTCVQLGKSGSFVAPSTGLLSLSFNDDNYFDNNGSFNACIEMPDPGLVSSGPIGGPFSPSSRVYTLTNSGAVSLSWSATNGQNWVSLSSTGGTLDAGAVTTVEISVNTNANGLAVGVYEDSVLFTNLTFGEGSAIRMVSLNVIGLPVGPTALLATAAWTNRINLSWADNSSNEDGFEIERAPDAAGVPGTWALIATVVSNSTTYGDTGLASGTTYWYRLAAYNVAGYSSYSSAASATTLTLPIAPSGLVATALSSSQIKLGWVDNSDNESGFEIQRALDNNGVPGTWQFVADVAVNATNYTNTGLASGTIYWYRVKAYNGVGSSLYSTAASAWTQGVPPAPSTLTASVVASNQVNLSWSNNGGNVTGFTLERSRSGSFFDLNITLTVTLGSNVTTYGDTAVNTNQTHWYRVRGFNSFGNSPNSSIVSVTIPSLPTAPSSLSAAMVSSNQINLSWTDNANNEDGFKIDRAPDNNGFPGVWTQIGVVSTNVIAYNDTGLAPTTRYWYRVRVYNVSGERISNLANASTAVGQNVWINPSSDKWEIAPNWSQGVPSSAQSGLLITNDNTKTVTIDATTVASNAVNGCMAIGALTIQAPDGTTNTLALANAGTSVPLHVLNSLMITNGGAMSITNAALQVGGTFGIDGNVALLPDSQFTAGNGLTCVGLVSTGQVTMTGGVAALRTLIVASNAFSVGTFTMTGGSVTYSNALFGVGSNTSASVWLTGGDFTTTNKVFSLTIGRFGSAQMTVSNGANLSAWITRMAAGNSSVGTLTVVGAHADVGNLSVGSSSNGIAAVWVADGQLIATNQGLSVADSAYAVGQMTVSNGTVLAGNQSGGLGFGVGGNLSAVGTFTMCGGALSSVMPVDLWTVGFSSGSKGVVWMNGGTVTATNGNGYLFLGLSGTGQWTLTNGSVSVANLYLGILGGASILTIAGGTFSVASNTTVSGSAGTVCITGGQLIAPNGLFVLGNYGSASLAVSSGVAVARAMIISSNNTANGALTMAGGQVTVFDRLTVGDCASNAIGRITVSGGTLYVTNAAHTGYLDLRDGTLTVSGAGALVADVLVITNSCGLFVGNGGTLIVSTLVLDPALDADGDGLPNGWEQAYGLDPLNAVDANVDSDGDGLSNLQEFQAGTDPTNSASFFGVTAIAQEGDDVLVTWMTGTGKTNDLQRTAGVGGSYSNDFATIFSVTNTTGPTTNYLDVGAVTNWPSRYYRVRLVP